MMRKPVVDLPAPFQKERAAPITAYYQLDESGNEESNSDEHVEAHFVPTNIEEIDTLLKKLFLELTAVESIEKDVDLSDQGLDSMSATEFVTQLESGLNINLDPDILFDYPLLDQLSEYLFSKMADQS